MTCAQWKASSFGSLLLLLAVASMPSLGAGFPAPKKKPGKDLPTLWEAAKIGDEEAIFDVLESGQKADALDEHGWLVPRPPTPK